jgi:hypothetical protein
MKKSILILCLLFVSYVNAQLQFINLESYKKATVYYKNGTEEKGLAKKISGDKFKFKTEKGKKAQKLDYNKVDKISLRIDSKKTMFQYKVIKGNKKPTLLEVIETGKISLYKIDYNSQLYTPNINSNRQFSNNSSDFTSIKSTHLYVFREGEKYASDLDLRRLNSKHFTKAALEYFKDCPILIQMIKDKKFGKRALIDIIEFYNEKCE